MRGIDWYALPIVAEKYGAIDIDLLLDQLMAIREFTDAR